VEAELPHLHPPPKKSNKTLECNTGNDCALNAVGTNSECAVPISVLFDTFRHNAKLCRHLSAIITLLVRVDTSAMFSLLHISTDVMHVKITHGFIIGRHLKMLLLSYSGRARSVTAAQVSNTYQFITLLLHLNPAVT